MEQHCRLAWHERPAEPWPCSSSSQERLPFTFAQLICFTWTGLWFGASRIALPSIGETLISRLGLIFFTRILATLGTLTLAAHQIALRVESLAFMPASGLSTAAAALVGQALGAKRTDAAEQGIRRTLLLGNGAMALFGTGLVAFGSSIVRLFGVQDAALRQMASAAIRISALELFGLSSLMILASCLRGAAGNTRTPMVVTIAGTFLFRVPATYLFAITLRRGLQGVWPATALDWSARNDHGCPLPTR